MSSLEITMRIPAALSALLVISLTVQAASAQDGAISKETEKKMISSAGDLNPFPGVSRENLTKACRAQDLKSGDTLAKAWSYYSQFRGSWSPNAPKPDPKELAAFDAFAEKVKSTPLPAWAKSRGGSSQPSQRTMTLDTEDPAFKDVCQTPETQLVKALCLVYFTEHELDKPGAYPKAASLIYLLTEKTPFDPEARLLFARAAVDAKDYNYGFYQARIGLYLMEEPTRNDLEFFCFVGAFAAKDKWNSIQASLRVLAKDPQLAESVITKQAVLFGPNARAVTTATTDWEKELKPKKP